MSFIIISSNKKKRRKSEILIILFFYFIVFDINSKIDFHITVSCTVVFFLSYFFLSDYTNTYAERYIDYITGKSNHDKQMASPPPSPASTTTTTTTPDKWKIRDQQTNKNNERERKSEKKNYHFIKSTINGILLLR